MLYRIKKPLDTNEWLGWISDMDYLNNHLINLNDYEIKKELRHEKLYIEIDSYYIKLDWLIPLYSVPKKIEKNIRG